jgi:site-specific recombinase XerD
MIVYRGVTGLEGGNFQTRSKYYDAAGIKKKASVHTLRHTFSTHQIASGLPLPQLKEILGHRKLETTYRYVHLVRTNLRENMEKGAL